MKNKALNHLKHYFFCLLVFTGSTSAQQASYHYSGALTVASETGHIALDWSINVLDPQITELTFVLRSSIKKPAVSGASVEKFSIENSNMGSEYQNIHIKLAPAQAAAPRSINMSYAGILLPEPLPNRINQVSKDIVELTVDSFWLPIDVGFNKLLTADLVINIGNGWQAVAEGKLAANDNGYTLNKVKPGLDIAFTLAKQPQLKQYSGFAIYDLRPGEQQTTDLVEAIDFCISGLSQHYGQVNPLEPIQFTVTERSSGGYARGNYIALTDVKNTDAPRLTQFVCHELAHHWSQGGKFDTVNNWLNEGFAEYVGMRMLRERFGQEAFIKRVEQFQKQLERKTLSPIWTPEITARPDYLVSYRKAPLALMALENKIGKPTFERFVSLYMAESTATTSRLLEQLESITDKETVVWFTQLLAK